ncbi:hypothetical protein [Mycoplasmopsis adleri]|uniref:hypothetical protein n=1 Tax=Mycoplasmopsis adleri TaxID=51362 RepID=UPI0038730462
MNYDEPSSDDETFRKIDKVQLIAQDLNYSYASSKIANIFEQLKKVDYLTKKPKF